MFDAHKRTLKRENDIRIIMEPTPTTDENAPTFLKAYAQVLNQRRMTSSMLRWSLDYAETLKAENASPGVTLYLL